MENGKGRINAWKRAEELDQPLGFGSWVGMVLSSHCYFLPCWVSSLGLIFSSPHCWFKGVLSHFSSQELFSIPFSFWFSCFRGFFSSFNCWCEVEKQRREANGGKLKPGRKNKFPYSLSWFVKVHAVFSVEEVKFCLSGLMKTQECVRKWCFYLVFRISSQHRIKGCCALRSVLFPMEKKIKLQHFQKFRCIPENLSGGCMALLLQLLLRVWFKMTS